MMKLLTERQRQILELIERHLATTGYPPTRLDICRALGFKSPNSAEEHLRTLARKGVIELTAGASRGIRLLISPQGDASPVPDASSLEAEGSKPLPASGTAGSTAARGKSRLAAVSAALPAWLDLPLVGRVAAGSPVLASGHIERQYQFPSGLFQEAPDYLLKVRGMSMKDAGILDGDLLAVKTVADPDAVRNGQIVVARIGDEVTVKRLQRKGSSILLMPENSAFEPIEVGPDTDGFALEGRGVGLIRHGGQF